MEAASCQEAKGRKIFKKCIMEKNAVPFPDRQIDIMSLIETGNPILDF